MRGMPVEVTPPMGEGSARVSRSVPTPILVTDTFRADINAIYGGFEPGDDEYPSLGITIQGSPLFVECVRFPDGAVTRRPTRDWVDRNHPEARELWREKLQCHAGKCRSSTVHIHPMNFPSLSQKDVANFDSLRCNPDDPSTFEGDHPYPVVLVNLIRASELEVLGFWVADGHVWQAPIQTIPDDSAPVADGWKRAQAESYYSPEGRLVCQIRQAVGDGWEIHLARSRQCEEWFVKAWHRDGRRFLLPLDDMAALICMVKMARSEPRNSSATSRTSPSIVNQNEALHTG